MLLDNFNDPLADRSLGIYRHSPDMRREDDIREPGERRDLAFAFAGVDVKRSAS